MTHGLSLSLPGFDNKVVVNAVVNKLPVPLLSLHAEGAHCHAKLSAPATFMGLTASLKDALTLITESDVLKSAIAIPSDPTSVSAATAAIAAPGSYAVLVQVLAPPRLSSAAGVFKASTNVVGSGALTITFSAGQSICAARTGVSAVSIAISSTNGTLAEVCDAINVGRPDNQLDRLQRRHPTRNALASVVHRIPRRSPDSHRQTPDGGEQRVRSTYRALDPGTARYSALNGTWISN